MGWSSCTNNSQINLLSTSADRKCIQEGMEELYLEGLQHFDEVAGAAVPRQRNSIRPGARPARALARGPVHLRRYPRLQARFTLHCVCHNV